MHVDACKVTGFSSFFIKKGNRILEKRELRRLKESEVCIFKH